MFSLTKSVTPECDKSSTPPWRYWGSRQTPSSVFPCGPRYACAVNESPSQSRLQSDPGTIGPGIAIAATGVGAGDLLAAMLAGANFGTALMWVVVVGAVLKLGLNEGVARWQLATGTTLLEGWCRYLGWPLKAYFFVYLVLWSFIVAGGLMSACGVAANALWPVFSIKTWAIVHSLVALALVAIGRYTVFETVMKT